MRRYRLSSSKGRVRRLLALLSDRPDVLVLTHDNPDPDAMGAALCLRHLLSETLKTRVRIGYGGIIGRSENRHMVRSLGIPLQQVDKADFEAGSPIIVVDTQPGFGNNSLPADAEVVAVIDHHPGTKLHGVPHVDVRPAYGAVSTILTEYVVSAGLSLTSRLATAVCYGIASETQDLGREATRADVAAFLAAFPVSDQRLLGRLRHPPRPVSFFLQLDRVIRTAWVADAVGICHMGAVANPDVPSEMADVLVSVDGVDWALCTGVYEHRMLVSLRTVKPNANAGSLLRGVIGRRQAGGHGMIAGGSLEIEDEEHGELTEGRIERRLLEALGYDPDAARRRPLTDLSDLPEGPP
ncbi:MAG: phosphoesterase [Candidatus Brocadiaceae bacterium]|nr:phosphoesterase [Candidatus Brocadiaceae bacterium]